MCVVSFSWLPYIWFDWFHRHPLIRVRRNEWWSVITLTCAVCMRFEQVGLALTNYKCISRCCTHGFEARVLYCSKDVWFVIPLYHRLSHKRYDDDIHDDHSITFVRRVSSHCDQQSENFCSTNGIENTMHDEDIWSLASFCGIDWRAIFRSLAAQRTKRIE